MTKPTGAARTVSAGVSALAAGPADQRVVAYTRVSTQKQNETRNGLEAQTDAIVRYAGAHELEVIAWERDVMSGTKRNRPGLEAALDRLEAGEAPALLVAKLDRLGRSVVDLGVLIETYFVQGRFTLLSAGDSIDTRTPSGRLVLHVLASVSQWEAEAIRERTVAALSAKRQRGEKLGGRVPYGYREDGGLLLPNADERETMTRARTLREEGLSLREVSVALAAEGRVSRAGRPFVKAAISKMLRAELA